MVGSEISLPRLQWEFKPSYMMLLGQMCIHDLKCQAPRRCGPLFVRSVAFRCMFTHLSLVKVGVVRW